MVFEKRQIQLATKEKNVLEFNTMSPEFYKDPVCEVLDLTIHI
jgi:hypothetical protein